MSIEIMVEVEGNLYNTVDRLRELGYCPIEFLGPVGNYGTMVKVLPLEILHEDASDLATESIIDSLPLNDPGLEDWDITDLLMPGINRVETIYKNKNKVIERRIISK